MTTFDAVKLGSLPAACMLLFTLLGLGKDVPPTIAGAMQHFAAGVLLCTVGTELLPEMVGAEGLEQNVAVGVGFFLGVALLILLGVLIPEHEDDNEEDINKKYSGDDNHEDEKENPRSFRANRQSLISAASHCKEFCNSPTRSGVTARTVVAKEESPLLPSTQGNGAKAFPLALVLAIAIDSALDGLLIGIACAAGPSAGPMMSASLSVEMSFLGLTLATALHGHPATKSIPASILGPLIRKSFKNDNKTQLSLF